MISHIKNDIEQLSDDEVLEVVSFSADLLHYRKRPQDTLNNRKRSLLSEIRECYRKVWHGTEREARRNAEKWSRKYNVPFRAYECTVCGGFHTTTKPIKTLDSK